MIEKAPKINIDNSQIFSKAYINLTQKFNDSSINRIEKDYLYWDKVKYLEYKGNLSVQDLWEYIKHRRFNRQKSLYFNEKKRLWCHYNINDFLQQKLHYLDFNFGAGLQKEQLLSDLQKEQYLNNALMEEAVFSSMIEGATTTRVKAKEMLRKNRKPKTHSEQMILNNYNTIQYISEQKEEDLTIEKIFELHQLVTENTLENNAIGSFRKTNDVNIVHQITGEIVHTPPNFEELSDLMSSFITFFNHNPKENFIHPIVKASILHFLIGYIHPFVDGNGRTARAVFYWYLLKNGYWLTEYLSISRVIMKSKSQYEKAYLYTEIDEMDITYFIHYQVKVLVRAFEELKEYVAKKKIEEKEMLKFLKHDDINERQATVLFKLEKKATKYFTVKEIENTFNITNQTARTDIEALVEKGFLQKKAINKKSFHYWKGNNFDTTFL